MKKQLFALLLAATSLTASAQEQPFKLPALSPTSTIHQDFSTSGIDITYSRPSMRGRKIFGELVALGEVWRTGANSATKIKLGEDLMIGGVDVKAGEYVLYTIPERDQWEVIINKGTSNWGAYGYNKEDDIARFFVKTRALTDAVQTFTINFENMGFTTCSIDMCWEKTKISIPVVAKNEERLKASIDKAINNPTIPYAQAASYYLETNQNLELAMHYANKAIEANPKAFFLYYMKARIAAKMGNRQLAIDASAQSVEAAKGTPAEKEYAGLNERLMKSLKK